MQDLAIYSQNGGCLPIQTFSGMFVTVSSTGTRLASISPKAPISQETPVTFGACDAWLAVAETCLRMAFPTRVQGAVD